MSAETEDSGSDSGKSVATESEAREMGWVPKEEFRGDPERWVSADEFVEHGRKVLPILQKNNERLLAGQTTMRQQLDTLTRQLEASKKDFETLQEFHNDEVTRRVEETRQSLKSQIKVAREENDVDREMDLHEKLGELNAANRAAEEAVGDESEKVNGAAPPAPMETPAFIAWKEANPWFIADPVRMYEALAVATKVRQERPDLVHEGFYKEVDKRLSGASQRPAAGKVEASRGGSTQSSSGSGRSYSDLPAEAKKQCDTYAKRFVNKDGRFKTEAEYRKHYVENLEATGYFQQQ